MRRNEYAEDGNVDARHDYCSAPFHPVGRASVLDNDCDTVYDNLHQELDLEDPKEENEEEDRYSVWSID